MTMIKGLATAGVVAAVGLGLGAASASAYSISGGSYTSTPSATHRFTLAGVYTMTCSSAVFSGTAPGADNTNFTPAYSGCRLLGFAATVTQSGTWNIKVTGGGPTTFTGQFTIPAGTTTTITVPLASCTIVVSGPQGPFVHGVGSNVVSMTNTASAVGVTAVVSNVAYTSSGFCPWGTGPFTDGVYTTGGVTVVPGIAIS